MNKYNITIKAIGTSKEDVIRRFKNTSKKELLNKLKIRIIGRNI